MTGLESLERYVETAGLSLTGVVPEEQNSDYESCRAKLEGAWWRVRTARITPTKPGAFVAVWERTPEGKTAPFSGDDGCAGLLVLVSDEQLFGFFKFPTADLINLGIYSSQGSAGKRGFRLYPPWSTSLNPQATRTQRKQAPFFEQLR